MLTFESAGDDTHNLTITNTNYDVQFIINTDLTGIIFIASPIINVKAAVTLKKCVF